METTLNALASLASALSPHITLLYAPLEPQAGSDRQIQERATALRLLQEHYDRVLHIAHYEHGAPYIEEMPQVGLSISHCEDLLCLVLAPEGYCIGLDIEQRSEQVVQVLPRACSSMELTELGNYPQEPTLKTCLLWGAKEAVYKAIAPKAVSLRSLHLLRIRQEGEDSYSLQIAAKETQCFYTVDCLVLPQHVLSLICYSSQA